MPQHLAALILSSSIALYAIDFPPLALTHVTVVDATGSPAQRDMTVIVRNGRIAAIGKSAGVEIPPRTTVFDGTGKFLIPGLIDMHVHTTWDWSFVGPLMLANGVTGVREMFATDLPAIQQRRREVAGGHLTGPRILAAGLIVDGPQGPWPHSVIVADATAARAAVDNIKHQGYDYVKVYSALSREAYFAIAEQAARDHIPFAGHVPDTVTAVEATNAGQRSFEHLYGISRACSTRETELRKRPLSYLAEEKAELDSFSEARAAALFATLRAGRTWQTPTLVVDRNAALYSDRKYAQTLTNPARLSYVPFALEGMWKLGMRLAPALKAADLSTNRGYFQWQLHIVKEMQAAGVGILAGTDTPNPFIYPGFALHDELELLVEAGLTPMQALQAATRNPAQYFGTQDLTGTVEVGKIADLDLLDSDPLENIGNTRRLQAVILGGRMMERNALDALLAGAENSRWNANPAALTLMGLVVHMIRIPVRAAGGLLLAVAAIVFIVRRRRSHLTKRNLSTLALGKPLEMSETSLPRL